MRGKVKYKISEILKKRLVILDGASGTELHKNGMPAGVCPEKWCIENPDVISGIHVDYSNVGADVVYTCTFGANRIKLAQHNIKNVKEINRKLAILAKKAVGRNSLVAGDIGPTGSFIKPFGDLDFEEAVDIFKEQVKGLLLGGVDLFVIETMMDIQEARAALIAVKELTNKFTAVTMTYEKHNKTLSGNDPISSLITLQSLGADAVGCNCSTGPDGMLKIISRMKPYAKIPLIAKPNAGIPKLVENKTYFDMNPKTFASFGSKFLSSGVNLLGGCCGTTPEHIYELKKEVKNKKSVKPLRNSITALSSARGYFIVEGKKDLSIIGEKINPTGKKNLQKELLRDKMTLVRQLAKEQENNGASLLDVNVGVPGINEKKAMNSAISNLSLISEVPLVIDSSSEKTLETALRLYPGRALINSISDKTKKLLSVAKKYGAMFILLPIAGKKIPKTCGERKNIIKKILKQAKKEGFTSDDIIVDGLLMAFSSDQKAPLEVLKTIKWCSSTLKINTVVGLSNVSFGMPGRSVINASFLSLAREQGLTFAIADPVIKKAKQDRLARALLLNKDKNGAKFIAYYSGKKEKIAKEEKHISIEQKIYNAILNGDKENILRLIKSALGSGAKAINLLEKYMIPSVIHVGKLFDKKEYFLPQLIASAEAMKKGFQVLEPSLKKEKKKRKKAIVLIATVKGDIHDIGKNIVTLMLKNHGFQIIDLGKDVSPRKIIRAIKTHNPEIAGLSALMTTTMVNMQEVIELAEEEGLNPKFMVGGAVVNKNYARSIGAEYAKDGVAAVRIAEKLKKK